MLWLLLQAGRLRRRLFVNGWTALLGGGTRGERMSGVGAGAGCCWRW